MRHIIPIFMLVFACDVALAQAPIRTTVAEATVPDGEEGARMLCDGQLSTKWCIEEPTLMPYSVTLDAGTAQTVREYGLATGDDTSFYPSRNPVTWRMSGSNDRKTWTLLDERRNDRSLPAEDMQEFRFKPRREGDFRYYRFDFLRMAGGTRIQLSEVRLYQQMQTPVKAVFVSTNTKSAPATQRRRPMMPEDASMVCDGFLHTKWCIDEPSQMPYSVTLDAGEEIVLGEYRLCTGDDTHYYPSRNPVAWRVSGSNDKQTWTTVDERQNNRLLRDENEQEYRFKTKQTATFRYYRFDFLRMTEGTMFQLSEIKLYK